MPQPLFIDLKGCKEISCQIMEFRRSPRQRWLYLFLKAHQLEAAHRHPKAQPRSEPSGHNILWRFFQHTQQQSIKRVKDLGIAPIFIRSRTDQPRLESVKNEWNICQWDPIRQRRERPNG